MFLFLQPHEQARAHYPSGAIAAQLPVVVGTRELSGVSYEFYLSNDSWYHSRTLSELLELAHRKMGCLYHISNILVPTHIEYFRTISLRGRLRGKGPSLGGLAAGGRST